MKRLILTTVTVALAFAAPALGQRSHPGGGPPVGHGPGSNPGLSSSHGASSTAPSNMSHGTPSDVLSHNPAIAGKIKALTGEDATTACAGFQHIGQCVAAAHVAKNLDIPGGFDALKAKITGSGAVSLGKAIKGFAPDADAKAETKKANKQADDDLKETSS